jgi:hypothetical protein
VVAAARRSRRRGEVPLVANLVFVACAHRSFVEDCHLNTARDILVKPCLAAEAHIIDWEA